MSIIAELYHRHCDELRRHLERKFGARSDEAEDVVHQAFANLAALDEPAGLDNPRAYLYSTINHILIDARRRRTSWRRGVEPNLLASQAQTNEITPERVVIAKERVALLARVLARLPYARRRSLLLNRLHGLSCAEIARREGYSESAVKKHVTLATAEVDVGMADADLHPSRRSMRTIAASVLAAGVAVAAAVAWFVTSRPPAFAANYSTDIGEVRDIALPDGSTLTLGARSQVRVRFSAAERDITLDSGEAFFSVTHDVRRPFVVIAGANLIRDLGTQFGVRRGNAVVEVGVLQGRVEVTKPETAATRTVLSPGQGVRANLHGDIETREPADSLDPRGWRAGQRTYIDWPLREIIADANRYSRHQIRLADPALGDLRLSLALRVGEAHRMPGSIALALPVDLEREPSGDVIIHARRDKERH